MRILHTSDWHLGRRFHEVDLEESFRAWVDWVVATVEEESVDVLVIAGDVYDRALPPVWAVELFSAALSRVRALGAQVVLTAGNHDSASRLGFGAGILGRGGVHIGADVEALDRPVTLTGADGASVDFFLIPYLDTMALRTARPSWLPESEGRPDDADIHAAALERVRAAFSPERPAVVLAHAFVRGGEASESEREIRTAALGLRTTPQPAERAEETPGGQAEERRAERQGGLGEIPGALFQGAAYTALGHLHRRQTLGERLRYSGSPLPFSMSEEGYAKGGWIVDLSADGAVDVRPADFSGFRPVKRITGTLEELLADPALSQWEDAFVAAVLTDAERPREPMRALQTRFPHAVELSFSSLTPVETREYTERVRTARSRGDVVSAFYEFVRSRPLNESESEVLAEALRHAAAKEASA
ncbi:exonuclease SbcCD subunit D [Arthrobacter sp. UM1]|uniref:exonuclease SbcCD subunit D n=1 Tax=Arthrobacter sp. UM1 TaxID=2766776 RepID=UPI001CF6DBD6|nr:exonuclease SbcCD subunit D [Arthrobacter sp. UM1]MCB4207263.1 exonuclease SbcCD subunit D [Arthrobacter sp. UM1]